MNVVKKKRLNPKVIRRGDLITIENCMFFVRCGYPLCISDLAKDILERRKKEIYQLIELEFPGYFNRKSILGSVALKETTDADDLAEQVAKKLAMEKIVWERYGGSEREIYEKSIPDLKNEEFIVSEVNFVKTGTRIAGRGSYYSYFGEYEFDPPTFDVDKTYKILTLQYKDSNQELRLEYLNLKDEDLRIRADNVKKLVSGPYYSSPYFELKKLNSKKKSFRKKT
jgi:hypothetical protein